jgi:hypothetical protein
MYKLRIVCLCKMHSSKYLTKSVSIHVGSWKHQCCLPPPQICKLLSLRLWLWVEERFATPGLGCSFTDSPHKSFVLKFSSDPSGVVMWEFSCTSAYFKGFFVLNFDFLCFSGCFWLKVNLIKLYHIGRMSLMHVNLLWFIRHTHLCACAPITLHRTTPYLSKKYYIFGVWTFLNRKLYVKGLLVCGRRFVTFVLVFNFSNCVFWSYQSSIWNYLWILHHVGMPRYDRPRIKVGHFILPGW